MFDSYCPWRIAVSHYTSRWLESWTLWILTSGVVSLFISRQYFCLSCWNHDKCNAKSLRHWKWKFLKTPSNCSCVFWPMLLSQTRLWFSRYWYQSLIVKVNAIVMAEYLQPQETSAFADFGSLLNTHIVSTSPHFW